MPRPLDPQPKIWGIATPSPRIDAYGPTCIRNCCACFASNKGRPIQQNTTYTQQAPPVNSFKCFWVIPQDYQTVRYIAQTRHTVTATLAMRVLGSFVRCHTSNQTIRSTNNFIRQRLNVRTIVRSQHELMTSCAHDTDDKLKLSSLQRSKNLIK